MSHQLYQPAVPDRRPYCPRCGGDTHRFATLCATCQPKWEAEQGPLRQAEWLALCPVMCRDTDAGKLPDQEAARRCLAHDFSNGHGLIMRGKSGAGKTRTAWLVVKQQVLSGKRVKVLSTASAFDYAAQFAQGGEEVAKWVNQHVKADLLLLDDVFKAKLTDSFESLVFALVDKRCEALRPLLVTTNDVGATLAARLQADRGEPLVRRLREFCDGVLFRAK